MIKSNNEKSLVIVESPAKSKTINKYLGNSYKVMASMGHVRDLPSKGLSVDIEHDFEPTYKIMPGKKRTVSSLKKAAKNCDSLYLATDLDREGEAIAWHLTKILKFPEEKTYRVIFNAITKSAINNAFENPGKLDENKVLAQQARRILDRIVGYKISPLLWKKVARGLSAGRVQSVAVKMIVEKERQIRAFDPQEYWLIPAVFTTDLDRDYSDQWQEFLKTGEGDKEPALKEKYEWMAKRNAFRASLYRIEGQKAENIKADKAEQIKNALNNADFHISGIQNKKSTSRPSPPFITSTLQQTAASKLGFSAKKTMRVAQQLYEGIELGSSGAVGLITYMRTDSTNLSREALGASRGYIKDKVGENYLPEKANIYTSKKQAQEAHEAIRATDPNLEPDNIKQYLKKDQYRLYDLIWRRFIASQMKPAIYNVTTLEIKPDTDFDCLYRATGRTMVFGGYTKIWPTYSNQQDLPEAAEGQQIGAVDITAEQHFTKPPARYTEASLVKALEKEGIGRPSTYASIISTIQDRKYAEQVERKFYATDLGEVVTNKLDKYFPKIMDMQFTRKMEERLDEIEEKHLDWLKVLNEFYGPFKENLEKASEEMKHAKAETQPSDYECPKCGKEMVYRFGKNGRFLSCSGYPDCKFAAPCDREGKMVEEKTTEHKCPKCGKPMVEKHGRYGKFLGCSDYPNCKSIQKIDKEGNVLPPKAPPENTGIKCYKCKKGEMVVRKSKRGEFLGCNKFPKCRTIININKREELEKLQKEGKWPPKTEEEAKEMLKNKKKKKKSKEKE